LNVSKFDHPGGAAILKSKAGTDITKLFDDSKHSLNAKLMLRDLAVGEISGKEPSK
jgi:cytochrome b involved in lipid metabolism